MMKNIFLRMSLEYICTVLRLSSNPFKNQLRYSMSTAKFKETLGLKEDIVVLNYRS